MPESFIMPRTKRDRDFGPSTSSSDDSDSEVEQSKKDTSCAFLKNIFIYENIFSRTNYFSLISKFYLIFLVSIPFKLYLDKPAKGKVSFVSSTLQMDFDSSSIQMVNDDIIGFLNIHRKQYGLKKIPKDVKLDIWFSYSSYAKMKLTTRTKSKFFSKLNQKFVDRSNFSISLHNMEAFVLDYGRPPAKKQRAKIADLRSGLNLTEAIQANQELFEDIAPENVVIRSGTANLVDSICKTATNTSQISQKAA